MDKIGCKRSEYAEFNVRYPYVVQHRAAHDMGNACLAMRRYDSAILVNSYIYVRVFYRYFDHRIPNQPLTSGQTLLRYAQGKYTLLRLSLTRNNQ